MTSILVTGGAGAIGSRLVSHLIANKYTVIVLDDLSSGYQENVPEGVKYYHGSVLDDALLPVIFQKHAITHIFHLAALFANQNSVEHPQLDLNVNGLGTLKILDMAHKNKVQKVVYTSSSCVYGNMPEMLEDAPLTGRLDTPYAITKLLGEQYCRYYSSFHGLNVVIARLFNSYGPGEKPGQYRNVIPNFFSKALKNESLIITGTGQETRDFTYVEDVIQGLSKLCFEATHPGDIFNLGSGRQVSISHLVETINEISKNTAPILYKPRRDWDHVEHRVANIQKAQSLVNFTPSHSLQEGLMATYHWITSRDF